MLTLYDNAFSPFARKVRMALEYKSLDFQVIDGLRADGQAALARVNPRREVPVVVDVKRVKAFFATLDRQRFERKKIFWRGDRIEWLLAAGFHDWLLQEVREGRVLWPHTQVAWHAKL